MLRLAQHEQMPTSASAFCHASIAQQKLFEGKTAVVDRRCDAS